MLKDFLLDFTKQYHELGHDNFMFFDGIENSDSVNDIIDSVSGLGHRIKFGHDFEGLSESFEIDGIEGITSWFDHMLKDFTSHDGIPLPGAEFVQNVTGMDYQEAVEWLAVDATDVLALGLSVGALNLVEKKLNNNPKMKVAVQTIAGFEGIVDDNPLLTGYIAMKVASDVNKKYNLVSDSTSQKAKDVSGKVFQVAGKICVGTFVTGVGTELILNESIIEVTTELLNTGVETNLIFADNILTGLEAADHTAAAADWVADIGELVDGAATLGLTILLSKAVKGIFSFFNENKRKQVIRLMTMKLQREEIRKLCDNGYPAALLKERLKALDASSQYYGLLPPPKGGVC